MRLRRQKGFGWCASGAGAVLSALLCLSAQLSNLAHLALVTHTTCAEHGELVHGDAHAAGPVVHVEHGEASYRSSQDGETEHDHDHCLALSERRDPAVLPGQCARHSSFAPAVVALLEDRSIDPHRDLLSSAPKQSPPA